MSVNGIFYRSIRLNVRLLPAMLAGLLLSGIALAADPGTLSRVDNLLDKPFSNAKTISTLKAGSKVEIIGRSGGWYQVKAGTQTGWLRMLSVRRPTSGKPTSVAGVAGVASGRTGSGAVVTTTGVRGLDNGELDNAQFNEAQIAQAEKLRVSATDAAAFAKQGGLAHVDAPKLPEPSKKKKKK